MTSILVLSRSAGTTDIRVMKQVRAAAAAGYDVTLLTSDKDNGPPLGHIAGTCRVIRFKTFDPENQIEPLYFDRLAWLGLPGIESHAVRHQRMAAERLARQAGKASLARRAIDELKAALRPFVRLARRLKGVGIPSPAPVPAQAAKPINQRRKLRLGRFKHLRRHVHYALNIPVEALSTHYDIIHAHDLVTLPGAVFLSKRLGAKLVYDAHEIETEIHPPLSDERKSAIALLESECFKHVDTMITVSPGCAAYYAKTFSGDIAIVLNVPERVNSRSPQSFRDQLGIGREEKIVVYTGVIGGRGRGLHKVIRALSSLPTHHLVILGTRQEKQDKWIRSLVGPKLAGRVHLLPGVPGDQVVAAIAGADLAICPIQDEALSYRHSLPNKLFEAMEARLPICVSRLPDMQALVEKLGIGVAMDQTSPQSIAQAISEISSREKSAYFPPATIALIDREYSWSRQVETQLAVYRSLSS